MWGLCVDREVASPLLSALFFMIRQEKRKQTEKHIFFFSYLSCDFLGWKIFFTRHHAFIWILLLTKKPLDSWQQYNHIAFLAMIPIIMSVELCNKANSQIQILIGSSLEPMFETINIYLDWLTQVLKIFPFWPMWKGLGKCYQCLFITTICVLNYYTKPNWLWAVNTNLWSTIPAFGISVAPEKHVFSLVRGWHITEFNRENGDRWMGFFFAKHKRNLQE